MGGISLGQIEEDKEYNFKVKYDEEGDIYWWAKLQIFWNFRAENKFAKSKN